MSSGDWSQLTIPLKAAQIKAVEDFLKCLFPDYEGYSDENPMSRSGEVSHEDIIHDLMPYGFPFQLIWSHDSELDGNLIYTFDGKTLFRCDGFDQEPAITLRELKKMASEAPISEATLEQFEQENCPTLDWDAIDKDEALWQHCENIQIAMAIEQSDKQESGK